jgi:hypothetical protein
VKNAFSRLLVQGARHALWLQLQPITRLSLPMDTLALYFPAVTCLVLGLDFVLSTDPYCASSLPICVYYFRHAAVWSYSIGELDNSISSLTRPEPGIWVWDPAARVYRASCIELASPPRPLGLAQLRSSSASPARLSAATYATFCVHTFIFVSASDGDAAKLAIVQSSSPKPALGAAGAARSLAVAVLGIWIFPKDRSSFCICLCPSV